MQSQAAEVFSYWILHVFQYRSEWKELHAFWILLLLWAVHDMTQMDNSECVWRDVGICRRFLLLHLFWVVFASNCILCPINLMMMMMMMWTMFLFYLHSCHIHIAICLKYKIIYSVFHFFFKTFLWYIQRYLSETDAKAALLEISEQSHPKQYYIYSNRAASCYLLIVLD